MLGILDIKSLSPLEERIYYNESMTRPAINLKDTRIVSAGIA